MADQTTERRSLHTPGPWAVEDPMDYELGIVEANKPVHEWQFIACIPHGGKKEGDFPKVIAEANARLIAAAPDLYVIGKELLAWVHGERTGRCLTDDMCQRLAVAIAKAEGRGNG